MSLDTRYESVDADGDHFDAYCARPELGRGPGILLFQEIFGINDNIRVLAQRLAAAGYVTLAPDMFWRIERRFERKDESGMADAFAIVQRFDLATAVADIQAAHTHLAAMPECTGKIGAVGFCFGGSMVNTLAVRLGADLAAAVPFYGGQPSAADTAKIKAPMLLQYAGLDTRVNVGWPAFEEALKANHITYTGYVYEGANHGFHNDTTPRYDEAAAKLAWQRTTDFFNKYLKS